MSGGGEACAGQAAPAAGEASTEGARASADEDPPSSENPSVALGGSEVGRAPTVREILQLPDEVPCWAPRMWSVRMRNKMQIFIHHYCKLFGIDPANAWRASIEIYKPPAKTPRTAGKPDPVSRSWSPPLLLVSQLNISLGICRLASERSRFG